MVPQPDLSIPGVALGAAAKRFPPFRRTKNRLSNLEAASYKSEEDLTFAPTQSELDRGSDEDVDDEDSPCEGIIRIGIGIGIGILTEKSGYNPTITPYHDQSLYSLQCHDLTACRARCIRILELLLDFELRRTVEEPKNQKTFFPGFWFPGPGNRCRDVSGDSKSTREPVLKGKLECCVQQRKLGTTLPLLHNMTNLFILCNAMT